MMKDILKREISVRERRRRRKSTPTKLVVEEGLKNDTNNFFVFTCTGLDSFCNCSRLEN